MKIQSPLLILIMVCLLLLFMIFEPRTTVEAARTGVNLWFQTVLPALFPFFVVCDLLVALGAVRFLGMLLEPVMRPLFRLPGSAGFVIAMGFTSGFPVGAVLTRELYYQEELTWREAEHLVGFTNNASPLFILGAVGVGLFQDPAIGYLLAFSHYLSNLLVGLLNGRLSRSGDINIFRSANVFSPVSSLRAPSGGGIGFLLGEAIKKSLANIMAIGGFIVVFSVMTAALSTCGLTGLFGRIFEMAGISYTSGHGIAVGLLEMTLGSKTLALSSGPLLERLLAVTAVLAWSGLSIQAQVMSIVSDTPVRYGSYIKNRLLQTVFALFLTYAGYQIMLNRNLIQPVFYSLTSPTPLPQGNQFLAYGLTGLAVSMSLLITVSLVCWLLAFRSNKKIFWNSP